MEKLFLLFGTSGYLGKTAVEYFIKQNYDRYYFFTRKPLDKIQTEKNIEIILVGDLTNEENVKEAFSKVNLGKDSLLFLFDTIGTYWGGKKISDTPYDEWQKLLEINLNSSFLIAKHFAKLVEKGRGGSICFVSAFTSLSNEPNIAAYGVSKNALNYLVKSLAVEGKEIKLSANAIAPYIIDTPENKNWIEDKSKLIPAKNICNVVQKIFDEWNIFNGNIIAFSELINIV